MVRLALCSACQFGRHDEHVRQVESVPKGMLGGVQCPCEGDCAGNMPKDVRRIFDALHVASSRED